MDVFLSDSDWESSSESGSSDNLEDAEYFYSGQASCILSSLEETIGKIDDFLSFKREFMLGDIVCSVKYPSGQMGKVVGIDMLVDLERKYGPFVKDVNSKNLLKICSISVGDFVVYGPWIGRVKKVIESVIVLLDDGTKYVVDQEKLLPICIDAVDDSQYLYYPGQRVRLSNVSKPLGWLTGGKVGQHEGTICSVEAGQVCVDWISSILVGLNSSLHSPPGLQDAKNLTLLSCFPHANWHLGDWCIFPMDEKNNILGEKFITASRHDLIKAEYHSSGFQEISVIMKKKTKVDVLWQDGSRSLGLDSEVLAPANAVNAHEFWPQQFVMEKGTCDDPSISRTQRWGVVQAVDAKERTVKVQWRTDKLSEGTDQDGLLEEIMSAYELVEHPDYSFSLGDIVFRFALDDFGGQYNINSDPSTDEEAAKNGENHVMANTNLDIYLCCIGNVTGFKDGAVEVRWANCSTSTVSPQEIFSIDKYEVSTTAIRNGENIEELRGDQIETLIQYDIQNEKDLPNYDGVGKKFKKKSWEYTTYFFPRAAIGFFSSILTTLFGSHQSTIQSDNYSALQIFDGGDEINAFHEKEVLQTLDLSTEVLDIAKLQSFGETSSKTEEIITLGDVASTSDDNYDQFRRFDVAADCPDHHFLAAGKESTLSQMTRGWLKKVQQEWSILKNDLPETIYVRVFEERMDLVRAVIIGAPGTPYHDGLFFFDIFLPPEYPQIAPLVYYISGGHRVNPNLYESGKVCLSLLNTWTGAGSEVWNPGSSTILQVLLSLQALVLNEKPYYNEAGYDTQLGKAEGERNSVSYNENAFIVTCKSMMFLLNKQPKRFEALVDEHFKRRYRNILAACRAYMEGAPVGFDYHVGATEHENQSQSSTGFKIMLAKMFPNLIKTFSSKGMDCSQFVEPENDLVLVV